MISTSDAVEGDGVKVSETSSTSVGEIVSGWLVRGDVALTLRTFSSPATEDLAVDGRFFLEVFLGVSASTVVNFLSGAFVMIEPSLIIWISTAVADVN
ncbi:hypothetical protein [[Phormidium] sp. LEGE 05292]|uniref:hypothetical protein n=1 Tax=[Phormidium] sp. LEGE 05292 TaxID=767427 RepID=UPI001D14A5FD|nr:hypothetical protein [Phormidium sp. LEGE 05292]